MQYLALIAYLVGGLLLGLILDFYVLRKLWIFFKNRNRRAPEIILRNTRYWLLFWIMLFVVILALPLLKFSKTTEIAFRKSFTAVFIVTFTFVLSKFIAQLVDLSLERAKGVISSTSLISNLTRILIFTVGFLVLLQFFGISITPLLAGLGVGGLAVALGLQDTLSNLFAGLYIVISGKIRVGDYIRLESGESGYVCDITWRNVLIRNVENSIIIVPNVKLASSIVQNYFLPDTTAIVVIPINLSYDNDFKKVERIFYEVAREFQKSFDAADKGFDPLIRFTETTPMGVKVNITLRCLDFKESWRMKHEFYKSLLEKVREEGIKVFVYFDDFHKNLQ